MISHRILIPTLLGAAVSLAAPADAAAQALPLPTPKDLVSGLDLECYETDPGPHPQFSVWLSQLNPQLQGIAPHPMTLGPERRQLCVPVRKNNQQIPQPVLDRIRWIDLEKFRASPNVTIAPTNVLLRHLNPLLVNLPPVPVVLEEANSLLVPVAKNGQIRRTTDAGREPTKMR